MLRAAVAAGGKVEGIAGMEHGMRAVFAGVCATRMAADLAGVLAAWPADIVIRESAEYGTPVAAEVAGLLHATVDVAAAGSAPHLPALVGPPLEALRARYGLPADPDFVSPSRYLTLHPFPLSFRNPRAYIPPTTHAVRPSVPEQGVDVALESWLDTLPARPTVYATLGTSPTFNTNLDVFEAIIAGLREEPVNLIVTVERNNDPARFRDLPAHVRVVPYAPLGTLLPRCAAVVNHGGSGTVMATLAHALPQVVVPFSADQPYNAARCVELGVGRVIAPDACTPAAFRAAVRAVLDEPEYRDRAAQVAAEIAALPGPAEMAGLVERLVRERRPLLGTAATG